MVDIVIVNWNGGDLFKKCVRSIFTKENESFIGKVFIIDNNSTDDSLALLPVHHKIVLIKNAANKGFSKACNQGFKLSDAAFVLLLNPDTQLFPSTLQDCLQFMNERTNVDILGCQLLDDNGRITASCSRFPTPGRIFTDTLGLSSILSGLFKPAILMVDWDHKNSRTVDEVMGAFMFMRNSVFKKAGYFDERFFVYYEELDFSKRLKDLKGISYYNAAIKAIHSGQGTTASVKAFRLFLNLKSRLQYAKKHFSFTGYALVWFSTFVIDPFTRTILLMLKGRFKEIGSVFKGYRLLLTSAAVG